MAVTLPDDLKDLLDSAAFAHLTTLDADGTPASTAMWVMRDGDHVVFNTAAGRRKERNMRNDPRVAVSISPPDEPYRNFSIVGKVVEMRTSDGKEIIDALSEKYTGNPEYQHLTPGMVRVTVIVEPTRIASW